MRKVYKYPLEIITHQSIETHRYAKPVHVGLDPQGKPCIWMEVNTKQEPYTAAIKVVGTGHSVPASCNHVGSFIEGPFVWHVYSDLANP